MLSSGDAMCLPFHDLKWSREANILVLIYSFHNFYFTKQFFFFEHQDFTNMEYAICQVFCHGAVFLTEKFGFFCIFAFI